MGQGLSEFLKKLSDAFGKNAKGLGSFILSLLFDRLISLVTDWIVKASKQKKESDKNAEKLKTDKKNAEAYKEVLNKENTTREEVKNATSDLLNKL